MCYSCTNEEYQEIKLSELIIDERVADFFDSEGMPFPSKYEHNLQDCGTFPLDTVRFYSVLSGFYSGLPAIKVVKLSKKCYKIMDGRHRIAATILMGLDEIPVIVEKN